jgi:hypothetical protein
MQMGVGDISKFQAGRFGRSEIRRDIADRINDSADCPSAASDQVGSGDGVCVQVLTQYHRTSPALVTASGRRKAALTGPASSFNYNAE